MTSTNWLQILGLSFQEIWKNSRKKINEAVDNYKKAAQKIKELKAQEDFDD